ncbi:MAG: hypothetical protein OEV33_00070 [Armatimonadota bacterium]|nr:hypothetical protein [Armatimonadota bacterium]
MKFGILNDVLGQREAIPHIKLPAACAAGESEWMVFREGAMRRLPGRTPLFLSGSTPQQAPDTYPFIHWHYHRTAGGDEYLFGFTKAHVYRWNQGGVAWVPAWTCGNNCTHWSTADFGPYVVATNNIDKVLKWLDTAPTDPFSVLGDPSNGIDCGDSVWLTKATHIIEAENYLILMNTTEGGTAKPNRRRWCSWGDLTDWDSSATKTGDAGTNDLEANNVISGCGIYSLGGLTRVVTFTQKLVDMMWLVEDAIVWATETILRGVGCTAPDSIIGEPSGNLYFLATDRTVRQLFSPGALSKDVAPTLRAMHAELSDFACAVYQADLDQLWWAIPGEADSTGNDLVLMYDRATEAWNTAPMDVASFGYYTTQSAYTIDTIPFPTIDSIAWPTIDSAAAGSGFPLLVSGDYAGYGYSCATGTQDKGMDYTGRLVLATDLAASQAVTEFKRLHGFWLFLSPGVTTQTIDLSIRAGHKASYRFLKSVSLDPDGDGSEIIRWVPCDARFRHCCLRFQGAVPFAVVGVVFEYDFVGDR